MTRLYGVELRRLAARRALRVLLLLLVVGSVVVMVIIGAHSNRDLAAAHAKAAALAAQARLAPGGGAVSCVQTGPAANPVCHPPTAADFYIDPRWSFAANAASLVGGAVITTGLLGLLVGATDVGAEWAAGTFQALLSWEPRRLRVLAAKTLAAGTVMVAIGVLAVALDLAAGWLVAGTRGTLAGTTSGLVVSLVLRGLRGLVIVGLLTVLGTAIAGLTRHTAAAMGAAVAYLVGFELVLAHLHPQWNRWLLTSNAIAFLNDRNQEVFGRGGFLAIHPFILSAHRGLVYLVAVVVVIAAAHAVSLVRRDAV